MSNYYEYADVKRKMVHRLFKMGWKIYGHHADNSDPMIDYFDPEYWCGIAEKNGYILVVNDSFGLAKDRMIKSYTTIRMDADAKEKIEKLERVTVAHGASEAEEKTAKEKIDAIKAKANSGSEEVAKEVVYEPAHLANPAHSSWHIEKDGVIVEKGTGLLKFADVLDICSERDLEEVQNFNSRNEVEYKEWYKNYYMNHWWGDSNEENAKRQANYQYDNMKKKIALLNKFNALMSKIDSAAGAMVGDADYEYKKVKETVKKPIKVAKFTDNGEIKDGQCFKVMGNFTYGVRKGSVYRIHVENGSVFARKLNGKLTKELTGTASRDNYWWIGSGEERFIKFFERGSLVWCDVVDGVKEEVIEKIKKVKVA